MTDNLIQLPPQVPTAYGSTLFHSRLAAVWAKTLDHFKFQWGYRVNVYYVRDSQYLPDFWLPEIRTIIDIREATKPDTVRQQLQAAAAVQFSRMVVTNDWSPEIYVLAGNAAGHLTIAERDEPVYLLQCAQCGRYWFAGIEMDYYGCRHCGTYDGDHHIAQMEARVPLVPLSED
jgi:hypothetical protein